jgi:ABC-type proline/glycine betaine transport system ATPase subunit
MAEFQRLNQDLQQTIVLVTHEPDIAAHAGRIILMRDGRIANDKINPRPRQARSSSPGEALAEGSNLPLEVPSG